MNPTGGSGRVFSAAVPDARRRTPPPESLSRAERRAAEARRSRPLQIVTVVTLLALLAAGGYFFFLRDDDGDGGGGSADTVSIGDVELVVGEVRNENAGPPAQLAPEVQAQVMTTVGAYVEGALLDVVREGEPGRDLATAFDAFAAARLDGPDRAVLLEEGLPELTGDFEPSAQPVILTGLSDGTGAFVVVSAFFNYAADAEVEGGRVTITRATELTMVPEGASWKITGYDVVLTRDGPGTATTTTTATS
jgi:hypothetical protein